MDGVFEIIDYSKFQDVNETIAMTWLSIFIAAMHIKKQHKAQFAASPFSAGRTMGAAKAACLLTCRVDACGGGGAKSVVFLY
ncbi:hypothetical protein IGS59_05595 [Janthinobacterium sp. GW460P]|uniref:hypothetical protein n=1 Tax=unclassified Janthinobacterium TaxID=2610881 RepID=UPI00111C1222|nr:MULTISPECIES: hypothetical protein [unclassified Janthinobacterium]MCC7701706.1 hypothetical protein [Janthinobacterium sp. GW460P]MCC7707213.1 hypothetical protein [Janthinobacterium sp. GW460W]